MKKKPRRTAPEDLEVRAIRSQMEAAAAEIRRAIAILARIEQTFSHRGPARYEAAVRKARGLLEDAAVRISPPSLLERGAEKTLEPTGQPLQESERKADLPDENDPSVRRRRTKEAMWRELDFLYEDDPLDRFLRG